MTRRPEEVARQERERLGASPKGPLTDLLAPIELVAEVPVVVAQLGGEGLSGVYAVRRGVPFILVNGSDSPVRARFTLAHEYGHHCLQHGQALDSGLRFSLVGDPREVDANRFAAELLLPRAGIDWWFERHGDPRPDLEVLVRVAHEFGVSAQVARYRLEGAGRLSRQAANDLDRKIARGDHRDLAALMALPRGCDGIVEARRSSLRLPARTQAILVQAVRAGLLSPGEAAGRLGTSAEVLTALTARAVDE